MILTPAMHSRAGHLPAWRHALLLLILPAAAFSASRANAQARDGGDWQVMLGGGAIYAPDYEGSDDYEVLPFPFLSVEYRDLAYIRGPEGILIGLAEQLGQQAAREDPLTAPG